MPPAARREGFPDRLIRPRSGDELLLGLRNLYILPSRFGVNRFGVQPQVRAGEQQASVSWTPSQQGERRPGRLRIWSTAPMGLLYCWSVWEASLPQLVYQPWISGPEAVVGS